MPQASPHFWKRVPFIRLIIPLISGIILQFHFQFHLRMLFVTGSVLAFITIVYYFLPFSARYTFRWLFGVGVNMVLVMLGSGFIYLHDIRHKSDWAGRFSDENTIVLTTLKEAPVEKAKTYKAQASVEAVNVNGEWKAATGNILMYFSKDSIPNLKYGSQVLFHKQLQDIKNSGNPGSFDYKQYNAFQNIYHQVFLKRHEYSVTNRLNESRFQNALFSVRFAVLREIQKYIKGEKEAGVAEALLIGSRDDLDKDLVQAYSNTGVVHIIAISGLHLGMIYIFLVFLLKPFSRTRAGRWVKLLVILTVLWLFTLLAGAVPSILRSAVMFSFILLGETLNRKSSIYNTLAASAFTMLCINPYYLWDVGFQLSYAAVVSIVAFSKPVYNWLFVKNKLLDFFWKLTSVTIVAQILTTPIIFYSFHQFPVFFLLTNCIVVPLSSVILFAELALLLSSFLPFVAKFVGIATAWMLSFMNGFIERVNLLPFAVYDGIQNTLLETVLLYVIIAGICYWLMNKAKVGLFTALVAAFAFILIASYENFEARQQQKIIVYNVQNHNGIDFITGKHSAFVGDSAPLEDRYLTNYNLKPSRTLNKVTEATKLADLYVGKPFIWFAGKRILLIDRRFKFEGTSKIPVDLIVIAHNPNIYIADLARVFDCQQYVFDASNTRWKINKWKKDCDSLHLRHYSTAEKGAFELGL
jgi:competence protein ComEC